MCKLSRNVVDTSVIRSLSRDNNEKKVLADSFRVPTVYRIGSLHLSEGVGSYRSDKNIESFIRYCLPVDSFPYVQLSFFRFKNQIMVG